MDKKSNLITAIIVSLSVAIFMVIYTWPNVKQDSYSWIMYLYLITLVGCSIAIGQKYELTCKYKLLEIHLINWGLVLIGWAISLLISKVFYIQDYRKWFLFYVLVTLICNLFIWLFVYLYLLKCSSTSQDEK